MLVTIHRSAAVWTVVGLAGGLFYRNFTLANHFSGYTQLAVVHTHALTLGTLTMLVLLALTRLFDLDSDRRLRWTVNIWNAGLAVSVGTMWVKGMMQVSNNDAADSPAIAGISGLGHIALTVAFTLLFVVLGRAVSAVARA